VSKVDLKVDWCSHEAAKYAVEHWHYSKTLPVGKLVKIGVWENQEFIGCILFGRGANNNMLKPYGLGQDEGCELVRVALSRHETEVTKIVAISMRKLKAQSPKLRLIVSYADTSQGHHGGIYQGGNWIYDHSAKMDALIVAGKKVHRKTIYSKYKTNSIDWIKKNVDPKARWLDDGSVKHRYLMPLDKQMRRKIQKLAKPYPKRVLEEEQQKPSVEGGATPTHSLHIQEAVNG